VVVGLHQSNGTLLSGGRENNYRKNIGILFLLGFS
jgi:hypothetical protein